LSGDFRAAFERKATLPNIRSLFISSRELAPAQALGSGGILDVTASFLPGNITGEIAVFVTSDHREIVAQSPTATVKADGIATLRVIIPAGKKAVRRVILRANGDGEPGSRQS
jgi:hypothetical protein